ncbi:hypothetical protein ACFFX0_19140 [Citricoccus parietis]|uniref:Uncharacterized protein n=1 Tax=Citricoccus parietis TaxID=592307 RepID=A0ABV5G2Q4_9MICC
MEWVRVVAANGPRSSSAEGMPSLSLARKPPALACGPPSLGGHETRSLRVRPLPCKHPGPPRRLRRSSTTRPRSHTVHPMGAFPQSKRPSHVTS